MTKQIESRAYESQLNSAGSLQLIPRPAKTGYLSKEEPSGNAEGKSWKRPQEQVVLKLISCLKELE